MDARQTPVVVFEEFLAPAELNWLQAYAAARERDFVQSQVVAAGQEGIQDSHYRRSRVLYDVGGFHDLLGRRIMQALPVIQFRLGVAPFPVTALELQLTASNDGEFFRAHTDSDHGPNAARTITFVYFCHREPFADVGHEIQPTQNSIVFFPSDRLHEIAVVGCPSGAFLDSRMTLNGWLHR
jgi:SM-20-related protein